MTSPHQPNRDNENGRGCYSFVPLTPRRSNEGPPGGITPPIIQTSSIFSQGRDSNVISDDMSSPKRNVLGGTNPSQVKSFGFETPHVSNRPPRPLTSRPMSQVNHRSTAYSASKYSESRRTPRGTLRRQPKTVEDFLNADINDEKFCVADYFDALRKELKDPFKLAERFGNKLLENGLKNGAALKDIIGNWALKDMHTRFQLAEKISTDFKKQQDGIIHDIHKMCTQHVSQVQEQQKTYQKECEMQLRCIMDCLKRIEDHADKEGISLT
ncbi:hypothetical protein AAMO2058_000976600 [Amorphochlora amoebiformis]|eukprot:1385142-Amorphochlora_amoeboformis.AAC.1